MTENKYQKALDSIVDTYEDLYINKLHESGWHIDDLKEYWILQELVDKAVFIEKTYDELKNKNLNEDEKSEIVNH